MYEATDRSGYQIAGEEIERSTGRTRASRRPWLWKICCGSVVYLLCTLYLNSCTWPSSIFPSSLQLHQHPLLPFIHSSTSSSPFFYTVAAIDDPADAGSVMKLCEVKSTMTTPTTSFALIRHDCSTIFPPSSLSLICCLFSR